MTSSNFPHHTSMKQVNYMNCQTQRITRRLLFLLIASVILPLGIADAAIQTVPNSLNPGDQYRLVFVTLSLNFGPNQGTEGTSSEISHYNQLVSNAANAVSELSALGVDWKVIGSTSLVSARENTNTDPGLEGVPIFLLDGSQMAANYADLWDIGNKGRDINITESGDSLRTIVWTGSKDDGTATTQPLGSNAPVFGNSMPSTGTHRPSDPGHNGWMNDWADYGYNRAGLYAMSSTLTVPGGPGVVPEATSFLIWGGIAITTYIGKSSLRRRNKA